MSEKTFYVTTPIYYGTAKPHLGSLYSTLIADVVNRWQQIQGKKTFFLTGTDEHGQKIAHAAAQAGKTPKEFVDSFIAAYQEAWDTYHIDYSKFIRTTDPYHIKGVQDFLTVLLKKGDVYKSTYSGWYCTPCETFVTDPSSSSDYAGRSALGGLAQEKVGPACPSCGRATAAVSEETYFFKLSAYQDKLLAFYQQNPDFIIPRERMQEVLSFVEGGLKDLSISRTTVSWGVPFPGDAKHVVYVWVDALCNYITALGYGANNDALLKTVWPADIQVIGKDIVRFHAVYWPALLMAAGLTPPRHLLVHGWITVNAQKMSKSKGNSVDPMDLAAQYGAEPVRYYLMRHLAVNQDSDFSLADLEQRITSDLANDLGNLLQRMVSFSDQYGLHTVAPRAVWNQVSLDLRDELLTMVEEYTERMNECQFHHALARVWKSIHLVNAYFHSQEPWKLIKQHPEKVQEILSAVCHSLAAISVVLTPIMPEKMAAMRKSLGYSFVPGTDVLDSLALQTWHITFSLTKIESLFQKYEVAKEVVVTAVQTPPQPASPFIIIEDVLKVELRVGTIESATIVPQSDKLLRLNVDFGTHGFRQILAGIRAYYQPEQLVGKQSVFVFNLKPRMMMGMESQGMLFVADGGAGKKYITLLDGLVPNGTRLS